MAKLYASEVANRAASESVQIHGGYGYIRESAISRFYADAKILEIGEGTNEVQRNVIAKALTAGGH
jgi:alkylation response protein AidB-like acyl-CoA dehydrogenase